MGGMFAVGAAAAILFEDHFKDMSKWTHTGASGIDGKFVVSAGKFFYNEEESKGLQTSNDARFYGLSAPLAQPFNSLENDLVLQFSVKFEQVIDCGGGYIKLLPKTDAATFEGKSDYYIMFGPDVCGYTKKIHLIFNYKGKNLLWKKEPACESDEFTHIYTLIVRKDGTYEVLVDGAKKESGRLDEDWDFLPPKVIDDPSDHKPGDWVDLPEMDDPTDSKPADWDKDPETIADPDAKQPEDWDAEEDGKWEPPTIPNPAFKGVWKAKRIPNPAYKGVWKAKQIDNPEYHPDPTVGRFTDIQALGFDLWQVKSGTIFDDIVLATDPEDVAPFRKYQEKHRDDEKAAKEGQAQDNKPDDGDGGADEDDSEGDL